MKEIKLTQNKTSLVDNEDFKCLNHYKWFVIRDRNTYYACRMIYVNGKRRRLLMHRDILKTPHGFISDHIDGNGLNNQRSNLRVCTIQQNSMNVKRSRGTSQYKGVRWHKRDKKWRAQIGFNNKVLYIGDFKDEIDAALAYDKMAHELHGEFANLNFK